MQRLAPISVLGTGMMSRTLARRLAAAGYPVMVEWRDPGTAQAVAHDLVGPVRAGRLSEAARAGDVVAIAFEHVSATGADAGELTGKVQLDLTSAWDTTRQPIPLAVGHTSSAP
ncbi:NAD(P)-binding domain-containing protein [Deinococcus ficus]|uniref:Pyrroline-5-carboxylate reductase catalytic N-terminal domain-containing protein n=1 Tax=Deinococcus ficus TaxID=317577 RepID=A0A221T0H0_9DEIO|nr:NAD(P)-binding domain-containing protein [Deinococcus ficus]ASN82360.1 hypothetical protein DFI_14310 [Deinococcus ficus]